MVPDPRPGAAEEFFDMQSRRYDAAHEAPDMGGHALRERLRQVLVAVGDGPGDLLDAGMGPGRLCQGLDERGWTVSGTDASADMVQAARRRLPGAASRMHVGRLEALPFADDSFDTVTATGVLEYVDDLAQSLRELRRVLRPSGRGVVTLPNPRSAYILSRIRGLYPTVRMLRRLRPGALPPPLRLPLPPSRGRFVPMLEAAGFRVVDVRGVTPVPVIAPFDELFAGTSVRLAERLAARGVQHAVLATQILFLLDGAP